MVGREESREQNRTESSRAGQNGAVRVQQCDVAQKREEKQDETKGKQEGKREKER
jgi:hypothetical protein